MVKSIRAGNLIIIVQTRLVLNFHVHFLRRAQDRQILILHPQSYEIFHLKKTEGHMEAGKYLIVIDSLDYQRVYSFTVPVSFL